MKETGTDLDFVMSGVKPTNVTWWRKKAVNWGLPRAEGAASGRSVSGECFAVPWSLELGVAQPNHHRQCSGPPRSDVPF